MSELEDHIQDFNDRVDQLVERISEVAEWRASLSGNSVEHEIHNDADGIINWSIEAVHHQWHVLQDNKGKENHE